MDMLLLSLFVLSLLFIGGNALSMHRYDSRALSPGIGIGESMEPAIPGGVTLTVEHYPFSVEEGDVVTYEDEVGSNVCHRVVEKVGPYVKIKGDNNPHSDGWFHEDEIDTKIWSPSGEPFWIPVSPTAMRSWIESKRNA